MTISITLSKSIVTFLYDTFRFDLKKNNVIDITQLDEAFLKQLKLVLNNSFGIKNKQDIIHLIDNVIKKVNDEGEPEKKPITYVDFPVQTLIENIPKEIYESPSEDYSSSGLSYTDYLEMYKTAGLISTRGEDPDSIPVVNYIKYDAGFLNVIEQLNIPGFTVVFSQKQNDSSSHVTFDELKSTLSVYFQYYGNNGSVNMALKQDYPVVDRLDYSLEVSPIFIDALLAAGYTFKPFVSQINRKVEKNFSALPAIHINLVYKAGRELPEDLFKRFYPYNNYEETINAYSLDNHTIYEEDISNNFVQRGVLELQITNQAELEPHLGTLQKRLGSKYTYLDCIDYVNQSGVKLVLHRMSLANLNLTEINYIPISLDKNLLKEFTFQLSEEYKTEATSIGITFSSGPLPVATKIGSYPHKVLDLSVEVLTGDLIPAEDFQKYFEKTLVPDVYAEHVTKYTSPLVYTPESFLPYYSNQLNINQLPLTPTPVPILVKIFASQKTKQMIKESKFLSETPIKLADYTLNTSSSFSFSTLSEFFHVDEPGDYTSVQALVRSWGVEQDQNILKPVGFTYAISVPYFDNYKVSEEKVYYELAKNLYSNCTLSLDTSGIMSRTPLVESITCLRGKDLTELEFNREISKEIYKDKYTYTEYLSAFTEDNIYVGSENHYPALIKYNLGEGVSDWLDYINISIKDFDFLITLSCDVDPWRLSVNLQEDYLLGSGVAIPAIMDKEGGSITVNTSDLTTFFGFSPISDITYNFSNTIF